MFEIVPELARDALDQRVKGPGLAAAVRGGPRAAREPVDAAADGAEDLAVDGRGPRP